MATLDLGYIRRFSWNFWIYLGSNFFWSLGLIAFFLVYNLHLLELGLNEAVIGGIASASTLGSLAVTLLTGWLLNRYGEIRVIQVCVLATAVLLPFRSLTPSVGWMVFAAFLNGASIGGWMVSAPPFLTGNTDPESRSWAFSLCYGSSIGTGALAGLIVGLGSQDRSIWTAVQAITGFTSNQCVLLVSSACVALGFCGLLFLRSRETLKVRRAAILSLENGASLIRSRRFILQLLTVLVLWSWFVGSFPPFFNVYFHRQFNQSLDGIGVIFSISQLCQAAAVLCMPWLVGKFGRVRAIFAVQFASALVLPALLATGSIHLAGLIYLSYLSFQVMAEPALENFIMDSVNPEERNIVASLRYMTLFSVQSVAVLVSGFAIARFGYSSFLVAIALVGFAASFMFYLFFQLRSQLPAKEKAEVAMTCPLH